MKNSRILIGIILAVLVVIQIIGIALAVPRYNARTVTETQLSNTTTKTDYIRGRVDSINNTSEPNGALRQALKVVLLEGDTKNQVVDVNYSLSPITIFSKELKTGEQIILTKNIGGSNGNINYTVLDKYRLDILFFVALIFAVIVFLVGGWRGLGALASLGVSIGVILFFTIPQLAAGQNILIITIATAFIIGTLSMFLSHGISKRIQLAWGAMIFTLLTAINMAIWLVEAAKMTGLASDESAYLQLGNFASLNFVGVIIASVVIASVGILDDVTASQAAVVDELQKANPNLTVWEVFGRSMSVGREHIASMVNSLVLVYLGTSFTTFLVLFGGKIYPLNVTINLERISQEIVSSLVVSTCLTLAVPITTFLCAMFLKRSKMGTPQLLLRNFSLTKRR